MFFFMHVCSDFTDCCISELSFRQKLLFSKRSHERIPGLRWIGFGKLFSPSFLCYRLCLAPWFYLIAVACTGITIRPHLTIGMMNKAVTMLTCQAGRVPYLTNYHPN